MRSIEAKPSRYKGRVFRSQLEARSAAWLDAQGFSWHYEPETLVFGDIHYTPDFYIPENDTLVEVKPVIALQEFERVEHLISKLQKPCLILSANETGEIQMQRLWNYTGPCGWTTGLPDCWAWHERGDFELFEFAGKKWFAAQICCTKAYRSAQRECPCQR